MRGIWLATAAGLALAGCSDPGSNGTEPTAEAAADVQTAAPANLAGMPAEVVLTAPRVAYVYRFGLELPVDQAPGLMTRHEQACATAGPAVCQVIGSETTRVGQDELSARLEIRATPAFIIRFRQGLATDADDAGGRVAQAVTESEDLTRSLSDTEARLSAQTTLRDRLQGLLATRSGSLEDLLKVETELARVQGQIDAEQAALTEMRTRVAMSRLTVEYRAAGQLAPDSAFRPVANAVQGSLGAMMATLAVLITILAALIPIGLIAGPIAWFMLRRRRAAKPASPPEP